jgi:hypothetical protein
MAWKILPYFSLLVARLLLWKIFRRTPFSPQLSAAARIFTCRHSYRCADWWISRSVEPTVDSIGLFNFMLFKSEQNVSTSLEIYIFRCLFGIAKSCENYWVRASKYSYISYTRRANTAHWLTPFPWLKNTVSVRILCGKLIPSSRNITQGLLGLLLFQLLLCLIVSSCQCLRRLYL